jgi:deoxyribonuclease-4
MIIGFHIPKLKTFLETVKQIPKICDKSEKKLINTCQIFTSSPKSSELENISNEDAKATKEFINKHDFPLFVHGKYIINLSSPKAYAHHAYSIQLESAYKLGAEGCIVHMGKSVGQTIEVALDNMESNLKKCMKKSPNGTIILETSCGAGSELLSNISDLYEFYNRFTKNEKKRIKFCIDTCHIFAAGYDITTSDKAAEFLKQWKKYFGFKTLALFHLNDSNGNLGSHLDRHAPIGKGNIGYEGLIFICRFAQRFSIPLILERGTESCCNEIKKIKKLV